MKQITLAIAILSLAAGVTAADGRIPIYGPLSVSVPGCVDGWFTLHDRFGRLPMADLLAPAADYAEAGFPGTEIISGYWAGSAEKIGTYDGFAETFLPGGSVPAAGEVFRNPRLAATYRLIAKEGRDAYYKGDVAQKIGEYMTAQGGYLSAEDLARHESEWVDPVSSSYRGYDVWELPPNGQGITVLQMLNHIAVVCCS